MNAYVGNEPFVFVSYAHSDKQIAESVINGLQRKMCRVFYDDGLTPGEPWNDELAEKVIKCECLVVLLTNNSASSKYVRTELNFAIAKDKTIIPVMFGKTILPPGIEMMLSPYQFIVVDPVNDIYYLENLVERLINALPTNVFSTNKDHIYQDETLLWESDDGSISAGQTRKELNREHYRKWLRAHVLASGIMILCYCCLIKYPRMMDDHPIIFIVAMCLGAIAFMYAFIASPLVLIPFEPDGTWQWKDKPEKYYVKVPNKKYAPRRAYLKWCGTTFIFWIVNGFVLFLITTYILSL